MLLEERTKRITLFVVALVLLTAALAWFRLKEREYALGVPVISPDQAAQYTLDHDLDLSGLTFNDEKAPLDIANTTLYLSQPDSALNSFTDLQGTLASNVSQQDLYFLLDKALQDPQAAVESGTPLSLIVVEGDSYRTVKVVLTTLPVLRIEGAETEVSAKFGYEMAGDCVLFAGFDPSTQSYSVQTSNLEWHIRGETTAKYDKKSYKVSLKDKNGDNKDCNFLGLGADDDWILNPMVLDDTKLREKTVMDLWNTFAETCEWDYKMSSGEYLEVILNGEYKGLYLLLRRVDEKYLDIDRDADVLLKGNSSDTLLGGYEIVSSPYNEEETYDLMVDTWDGTGANKFHRNNFIDVSLLINYLAGSDNAGFKNMFYYLKYDSDRDGYDLYLIPWDTDMSFGFYWNNGFTYDFYECLTVDIHRIEYYTEQLYSEEMDLDLAQRWRELRSSLFSESAIVSLLDYNRERILSSGAYQRELERWGMFHQGVDTQEKLYQYCTQRLTWLDTHYS